MKRKIKTRYGQMDIPFNEKSYEPGGGKSMTIPDMTFSIPEILERFTRGIMPQGSKGGTFNDGNDILEGVDPRSLDLSEKKAVLDHVDNLMEEQNKARKEAAEKQERNRLREEFRKEFEAETAVLADSAKLNEPMKNA